MEHIGVALLPRKAPSAELALSNRVFVSQATFAELSAQPSEGPAYVEIKGCVFSLAVHGDVKSGEVALSDLQRKFAKISMFQEVVVKPFVPPSIFGLGSCSLEVDFVQRPRSDVRSLEVKDTDFVALFRQNFGEQVMSVGQVLALEFEGTVLKATVTGVQPLDLGEGAVVRRWPVSGLLSPQTEIDVRQAASSTGMLRILSCTMPQRSIFRPDFDFEELGIGGLSKEFSDIFRRAFAPRVFPPHVVRALGTKHVRGMLLYGPPGTGKTLIARQLAKFLKAAEPKIVNGPEILNKYVGQGEENVRKLFADAEHDERMHGDRSQLHVIILDEIDAICKQRGSTQDSTGTADTIVTQMLSKIDGVEALNNVLLIGMTNRIDMLDRALLRPGRLELHVEISLPDEAGRVEILNIHTSAMRENGLLEAAVSIPAIAKSTRNFSGAELEGLVRAATSFAMSREVDVHNLAAPNDLTAIRVTSSDFDRALVEVKPAFGQDAGAMDNCIEHGIVAYSSEFERVLTKCRNIVDQVRVSERTSLMTLLLAGPSGCGKTALAAHLACRSDYPFIRRITSESYAGESEQAKIAAITQVFDDAYKSPLSLIILDDLERILDYVCIGPRFSNSTLQLVFSLLKKRPRKDGHRMLVIGTTSDLDFVRQSKLLRAFGTALSVPMLSDLDHFVSALHGVRGFTPRLARELCAKLSGRRVGIRTMLQAAEMAVHQNNNKNENSNSNNDDNNKINNDENNNYDNSDNKNSNNDDDNNNPVWIDVVMECLHDANAFDDIAGY